MKLEVGQSAIIVEYGDITECSVQAIVNAANNSLLGGGGVDGAIHRKAGPKLLEECRSLGGCPTGEAKITKAYNLPSEWVIHTVGPVYRGGTEGEPDLLAAAYRNSLKLAEQYCISSIAFPAISTGVFSYPLKEAAQVSLGVIKEFLVKYPKNMIVKIILFQREYYQIYEELLSAI